MLEVKLVKESLFLNILEAILDLVDVAHVDCSSTGLKLQAVDTEHVAIIVLLFPAEDFQHYHCDEDLSMGIPIDDMVKAIRWADKDDTITMKIDDENFDTITLSFESPKKSNITIVYDLRLVDATSQLFQIPDWQVLDSMYQAFVQMPSAEYMRVCKFLSNIGDVGHISVTEKGLEFSVSGISGHVNIQYAQPEEATATVVTMRAPVSLILDLKYMNSFAKASTLFNQVKICLATMQPLIVECKIGQMGYIRYFLAPNIKTEIKEEESKEIKGSREDKERSKKSEDEGIKERGREIEEEKEAIQKESKDRIG